MGQPTSQEAARAAAAQYLRGQGYAHEAEIVLSGKGDDFVEVRIAAALWNIMHVPPTPPVKRNGRRLVGEEC